MGGVDFNLVGRYSEFSEESPVNIGKTLGQLIDFRCNCCGLLPATVAAPGAKAGLCRAIPRDGVCATDLSREPARYRGLPIGARVENLSHWFSRAGPTINSGRRERDARLAHLRGLAHRLIAHVRKLYASESLGMELANRSMLWIPRPSICACRYFHGRTFAPPRRR